MTYNELNSAIPDYFSASLLGNLRALITGIYSIPNTTTLNLNLILDAQNNPDAVFVIKINRALFTSTYAKKLLLNGAQAKNVF